MSTGSRRFESDGHVIHLGDALEVLAAIPDASVNLVFADPPYNIGKQFGSFKDAWPSVEDYAKWCTEWLDLCISKLTSDGSMYVMSSTQAMPLLDLYLRERIHILSRIVWTYDSSGVQARRSFGSLYEPMLLCVKDKRRYTFNAGRHALEILDNVKDIIAIEFLTASQAVDLIDGAERLGVGTSLAYRSVREVVRPLQHDRELAPDIASIGALTQRGGLNPDWSPAWVAS